MRSSDALHECELSRRHRLLIHHLVAIVVDMLIAVVNPTIGYYLSARCKHDANQLVSCEQRGFCSINS